jgi:fatty acid desaturase
MDRATLHDRRARTVEWRDLLALSAAERVRELLLSAPWLALSLVLAHYGVYSLALAASFVFFLAGLRQAHGAFHQSLGLSWRATEAVLFVLSSVMLCSLHAVRFNHLRHHRHCLDASDVEAMGARGSALRALLIGPHFTWRIHATAWREGDARVRRRIGLELAGAVALIVCGCAWLGSSALAYHYAAMALAQCLTAFFAVWTVHRGCERTPGLARTLRGRWKSAVTLQMFFHAEHHLFPAVPTCRLRALADRLDRAAPELRALPVLQTRFSRTGS